MEYTNQISRIQYWLTVAYVFSLLGFSDIPKFLPVFYLISVCYIGFCGIIPMFSVLKIRRNSAVRYYFLLLLWVFFSAIWQVYDTYYSQRVITMSMILMSTLPLSYMVNSKEEFDEVIDSVIVGGVLALIFRITVLGTASIEGGNGIAIAGAIIFSMCLSKYCCNRKKKYILYMFIIVPVIFFTASRRAILYVIISYVIIVFFSGQKFLKKIVISILLGLIALYLLSTLPAFEYMMNRILVTLNPTAYQTKDYSTIYRMALIEEGWKSFVKRPILGYGVGYSFEVISYGIYSSKTYLHNNYLELMVGLGTVGTILYYSIYIHLLRLSTVCPDKVIRAFACAIVILFLFSDIGSVSYYDKFSIWTLILISFGGEAYGRYYGTDTDVQQGIHN